ncbi:MAG: hypothetical protein MUO78_06115, partial [candidate division Zixibacteria bacterium]|nr:hypothetical protein [candidate division Zixibacteria bacterium]
SYMLYTQGSSRTDSNYKAYTQPDSLKLKNPNTALFYAAIPGFFVHGAGHFYANKPEIGSLLFISGMLGLGVYLKGSMTGLGENAKTNGGTLMATGAILFLGSWIYDMIKAPQIIEEQNNRLLYKNKFS